MPPFVETLLMILAMHFIVHKNNCINIIWLKKNSFIPWELSSDFFWACIVNVGAMVGNVIISMLKCTRKKVLILISEAQIKFPFLAD